MDRKIRKLLVRNFGWFLVLVGFFACRLCLADSDPLESSLKPQIQALFGAGSTVAYGIYIGEIVMGSVAYVKTKNLMLLLGVPILMLFTHTMFTYISS
jgi:hypothetical protein